MRKFISFRCVLVAICFFVFTEPTISSGDHEINALTFKWYDNVTAEKVETDENNQPAKHLAELTKIYSAINGTYFVDGTNFSSQYPDSISRRPSKSFVETVFYSYKKHHNLIIRPDDVWTAIIVQFSLYVNANAEALRHSFVKFDGKKKLKVEFYQPIDQVPISEFIDKIVALIDGNINPSTSDWIKPNFTTTTKNDELTAGAALMATLQSYFDYQLSLISCGIPEVTMMGTVEDWQEIRLRVGKLEEFELNGQNLMARWSSMLREILDEFINVKKGETKNSEFWKQAIRIDYKIVDLVCAKFDETYLNGWITAFSAFDKNGKWQTEEEKGKDANLNEKTPWFSILIDDIAAGVVHVPINIVDAFAAAEEEEYTGAIITGHMGHLVKPDEVTLQPLSGWAMIITNKPPKYL